MVAACLHHLASTSKHTSTSLALSFSTSGNSRTLYQSSKCFRFLILTVLQDASSPDYGKIIDPYAHEEIQYSTPTFAFAGATLYRYKHFDSTPAAEMLASVDLAMTAALTALVYGQPHGNEGCAQGHCNFYTMPLMLAIETLNGTVNASLFNTWTRLATQIVPTRAYRAWPHATGNWAVVALTGEFIRYCLCVGLFVYIISSFLLALMDVFLMM